MALHVVAAGLALLAVAAAQSCNVAPVRGSARGPSGMWPVAQVPLAARPAKVAGCCPLVTFRAPLQAGSAPQAFNPGPFDGGPAPATGRPNCPDAFAVPPNSRMPFWLGAGTASYHIEASKWRLPTHCALMLRCQATLQCRHALPISSTAAPAAAAVHNGSTQRQPFWQQHWQQEQRQQRWFFQSPHADAFMLGAGRP